MQKTNYLTTKQAAAYLGLSVNALYKLSWRKVIPHYAPLGKKLLFRQSELDAWVQSYRVATTDELEAKAQAAAAGV